jgi:hypothetical protein
LLASCLSLAACGSDDSKKEVGNGGDGDEADGDGRDQNGGDNNPGTPIPEGNCDDRHCYTEGIHTCFQWAADDAQHQDLCKQFGGVVGDGACPTEGLVAGCKTASPFGGNGCAINWGYVPISESDIANGCGGLVLKP